MFYQVQYFTNANDRQLIDSHLVEVPSRERAADFVRHQHEHTGADVLMQRIHTTDDSIAPPGWTYETRQIWVEGLDTGWCRKWVKQVVTAEMLKAVEEIYPIPTAPHYPCDHAPVIQGPGQVCALPTLCRRCGRPIDWNNDTKEYELVK